MGEIPAGIPQIPGEGATEGFTRNYVTILKGYFCKYICQQSWDNFYEETVLLNVELRKYARAVYNEQTEEEFHNALYDNDADYTRLAKYVLQGLVNQGLLTEEKHEVRDSTYWKTAKLNALCSQIVDVILPGIDSLVEEYDKQHPS
jgi:hypothetical protein